MQHLPIIEHPSGGASLSRKVIDGLINSAIVNPHQAQYIDGLITHVDSGARKASLEPIRAVGSYVGAPVTPRSKSEMVHAPKTKSHPGMRYPVGQN